MMIDDKELDDILNDPLFDLSDEERSLFSIPDSLRLKNKQENPDYVAQRKPCANFSDYEFLFKRVHHELNVGKRSLVRYNINSLKQGSYYIVSGVMVYLDSIEFEPKQKNMHHPDGRTRVIYENGTESDIKINTLAKYIITDGYVISECKDTNEQAFNESFGVNTDDTQSGWIYVLRSLSRADGIVNQENLYKIGFSTNPVEERIRNCEYEPTYLMDRVEIVASWKTYNMNTQRFEALIHQFFASVRFHVKVYDMGGQPHDPYEWFIVPLPIIQSVINHIIDGSIVNYCYNHQLQMLEEIAKPDERVESERINTEGWAILTLIIKDQYFKAILSGEKTIEYRELKQSKINTYTWVEQATGARYLKQFDALRLYAGYNKDRDSALVEVVDTTYTNGIIEYHLGKVLEVNVKGESKIINYNK